MDCASRSNYRTMAANYETTRVLILRKTPYSESSLVLAGISPDLGCLHFLVRGGRKISGGRASGVDLFRVFEVQFRRTRSELYPWHNAEMAANYADVALQLNVFKTASWLGRFALLNLAPLNAQPRFFLAMTAALQRLSAMARARNGEGAVLQSVVAGVALVYLDENGLLPDYPDDPDRQARREALLAAGEGKRKMPVLTAEQSEQLAAWTETLLHDAECRIPGDIRIRDLGS